PQRTYQSGHIRAALRNRHETSRHHYGHLRLQHCSARRDAASQPSSPPGTGTATRKAARRHLSDDGEEVSSGIYQVRKTRIALCNTTGLSYLLAFPAAEPLPSHSPGAPFAHEIMATPPISPLTTSTLCPRCSSSLTVPSATSRFTCRLP